MHDRIKNDNLNCGGDKREDPYNPPSTVIKYNRPLPHHDFILAYLGRNQQEYLALLPVMLMTTFYCPICGTLTHFNQWKLRSAWSSDDITRGIPQLQVLCTNPDCEKTHVVIPDFLNPYKRYVGAEIEASIDSEPDSVTYAEESTVRRWRKQFSERLPHILNALIRLLVTEYGNMISLLDCSQGMKRLRRVLELFQTEKYTTMLGRANLELFSGGSSMYF